MAATASIGMFGDKVVIGALDTSFLPGIPKVFPGTLVANGPAYFGLVPNIGVPMATVMIGPPMSFPAPLSLQVHGISNYYGVLNVIAVSNFTGLCTKFGATIRNSASITNGINTMNGLKVGNAISQFNANINVAGFATIAGLLAVGGNITCAKIFAGFGAFGSVAAPFKKFDIPHPSKGEGHRLAHACIEGPEVGVYVRGVLKGENVIELPDYWKDLVHEDSITVHLTPIGVHQDLCYTVSKASKLNIIVNPHSFKTHNIRCSYLVCAERKDVPKLVVEYEGDGT